MPPDSPASKSPAVGGLLFRTLNSVEENHQSLAFSGTTSPFAPASAPDLNGSALTIADVMHQLPPELARTTFLPPDQPIRIAPSVLNQALSSGQLAIPLFEVYRVCPGIFQTPVSPDDARLIQLPHSKLSALVSLATTAQAPNPNHSPNPYNPGPVAPFAPAPANSPFSTIAISSPFGIQVDGHTPSPRMDFPLAATKQKATLLPPRRDSAQAPDRPIPPSTSQPGAPFSAVAETSGAQTIAQLPEPQPLSLFPDAPLSPFAVANPEAPSAAASPSPFGLLETSAASPFALAEMPDQQKKQPLINGPATASVSNLLKEQPSDALGFDPALVPSWITTQLSAGVVSDLNAMNEPKIELGTVVDGITDLGFRSVLRSARRHHLIPIALRSLSPIKEAGFQSTAAIATPPPLSQPVESLPPPSALLLPTGFSSPESPIPSEKVKLGNPSSPESNASLIRPLAPNAEPPVSPAGPAPAPPPYLEFASALDPFASAGDAYYSADARNSGFSSFDLMGGSPTIDSPPPSLFSHELEPVAFHSDLPEIPSASENLKVSGWPVLPEQNTAFSSPQLVDQAVPPHSITPPTQATSATSSMGLSATTAGAEEQLMLRALLSTDEKLTLARVMELTVDLPGISACALVQGDQVLAAESIQNSGTSAFHNHAVEVARSLRTLAPLIGIADAETFTLNTANHPITLCYPGTVTLVILHDREPSLGLRDKLTLIARQLARMIPQS